MTAAELIEALGGNARVAQLTHRTPQAVANWKVRGLPARVELRLYALARQAGLTWRPAALEALPQ